MVTILPAFSACAYTPQLVCPSAVRLQCMSTYQATA